MKFREKSINKLYAFALAAVFAIALAGCGGGGGTAEEPPPPMPTPQETCEAAGNQYVNGECLTPAQVTINTARANIAAATTAEEAQAAYDAVKDDVTATQGDMLQALVDARIMAINLAARVDAQKMALSDAAGMIDTSDLSTQEMVDAANEGIRALRQALEDAEDVSDEDKEMYETQLADAVTAVDDAQDGIDTATRRTNQMTALSGASDTLQAALAALAGSTPTQAQLDAANNAVTALNEAIAAGADLTEAEKATYVREAANAAAPIRTAQAAFDAAEDEDQKAADAAAMANALKLHAGLQHGLGNTDNARNGVSDTAGVITVTNGSVTQALSEDKKTPVAANHGWAGKRHTAEPDDAGTYEAYVYSNVGDPTEGDPFNEEYTLNTDGETGDITALSGYVTGRVASPNFDQSAGAKLFKLPTNAVRVMVAGSYHGVSGNYYCTPTSGETCSATIAESGFTLAGGTWSFKPGSPTAKVMSVADAIYASYGWWIHTSEDGNTFTASAFATSRGTVDAATGIDTLRGSATYMGGAAGKYALHSATGGTNDAGHFTARATLEADFNADMITGTIDQFVGADGESRNWSVELKKSGVGAGGAITGSDGTGDPMQTVWTIDGTAAGAAGQWSGTLYDNGDDGVPKVGTGTFHSTYSTSGRMVGGFGVNKQ